MSSQLFSLLSSSLPIPSYLNLHPFSVSLSGQIIVVLHTSCQCIWGKKVTNMRYHFIIMPAALAPQHFTIWLKSCWGEYAACHWHRVDVLFSFIALKLATPCQYLRVYPTGEPLTIPLTLNTNFQQCSLQCFVKLQKDTGWLHAIISWLPLWWNWSVKEAILLGITNCRSTCQVNLVPGLHISCTPSQSTLRNIVHCHDSQWCQFDMIGAVLPGIFRFGYREILLSQEGFYGSRSKFNNACCHVNVFFISWIE